MERKNNEEAITLIAKTILDEKERENIVFVFGAGASIDSGMAPTSHLKNNLKNFLLALKNTEHGKKIQNILYQKFNNVDNIETAIELASLEYLISIGCEVYGEEQILNWLKQYIPDIYSSTDIRYFAPISYEYVAHLMGNKLIKHVVSLNYDELLDRTIEDELGKNKCYFATTDEDFERLKNEVNWENIAKCFLFKPHGTMSIPLSIKHKYEQTLEFSKDRAEVLKKLFKNKILVLIGYSASDQDFRYILLEQLLIGHVNKVVFVKANLNEAMNKFTPEISKKYFIGFAGRAEKFFKDLEDKLKTDPKYRFYTKATRHFIRWEIFKKFMPGNPESDDHANKKAALKSLGLLFFTKLNLLVEILIFCFKTRGLFSNLSLLNCNRIISALSEHLKSSRSLEKEPEVKKLLEEINSDHGGFLKKIEREGELESYWYYLPLLRCNGQKSKKVAALFRCSANKAINWLNDKYLKQKVEPPEINELVTYLYNLQEDFDYDLTEQYTPFLIFKNPQLLNSREKFSHEKTNEVLKPEKKQRIAPLYCYPFW